MQDILSMMSAHGLNPETLIQDGQIHRFQVDGSKSKPGWYAYYTSGVCVFGNFKTDLKITFRPTGSNAHDVPEINAALKQAQKEFNKQKEASQLETAKTLTDQWQNYAWDDVDLSTLSYFKNKKITPQSGIKAKDGVIHIPLYQPNSDLVWTFQKIYPDGDKKFTTGGKAKGGFFTIDGDVNKIYLCEGFATGAAINMATGCKVICCFSASGLVEVAKHLPKGDYVIAADDDQWNSENAGRKSAIKASQILNSPVVYPKFKDVSGKPTDFNDLLCLEGIDVVREQLKVSDDDTSNDPFGKDVKDDDYYRYADFFDKHLNGSKKDIISGQFLRFDGQFWNSPLNNLDAIKSYAESVGLKAHKVLPHLDRYILELDKEPLMTVPSWDGVDRIKNLGEFIKLKTHPWEIFEDAFKEWLANVFRRLYEKSAQNRCIILKGAQGIGKDHLLRSLLKSFDPYYSKFSSNRDEREAWSQVTTRLILHIEEFDQTGQMSVAFLKDLITRDYVTYRSPYDRAALTRKCYGSFISTVNIDAVLRDETGNRRFAVFEVDSIDWSYPKDWADQILAQAHSLYKDGYKANKATWDAVMVGNAQFEQVDLVPELLQFWDASLKELGPAKDKTDFSFRAIQDVLVGMCKVSGWKQKTILTMLKTNGRSKHGKYGSRYFYVEEKGLSVVGEASTTVIGKGVSKVIKNYATGQNVSLSQIDHPSDHQINNENDVPF